VFPMFLGEEFQHFDTAIMKVYDLSRDGIRLGGERLGRSQCLYVPTVLCPLSGRGAAEVLDSRCIAFCSPVCTICDWAANHRACFHPGNS